MTGLVIATMLLALACFLGMRKMRVCGARAWDVERSCTRVHFRRCYEKVVEAHDYHGEPWKMRMTVVGSEHVWTNDEVLYRLEEVGA